MADQYCCIIYSPGYVESHYVSFVGFLSNCLWATKLVAVQSLAQDLFRGWFWERKYFLDSQNKRECCVTCYKNAPGMRFCTQCKLPRTFLGIDWFADSLYNMPASIASGGIGGPITYEFGNDAENWYPWNSFKELQAIPPEQVIELTDGWAEQVIVRAMGRSYFEKNATELKSYVADWDPAKDYDEYLEENGGQLTGDDLEEMDVKIPAD